MPLSKATQTVRDFSHRTVPGRHEFLQDRSQQPGDAGIAPRRLDAGPLGYVFLQGDGYVAKAARS